MHTIISYGFLLLNRIGSLASQIAPPMKSITALSQNWSDHDKVVQFSHPIKDVQKMEFPEAIADDIGFRKEYINNLKRKGCPFVGRKTCILWVREFLAREAGAAPPYSMQH